MPEIPTCTWKWDGKKWDLIKGGEGMNCQPPDGGRPEPGETTTVPCPEPSGQGAG